MQAAMQINNPFFSAQGNLNVLFGGNGGVQQPSSRGAGFNGGNAQSGQMANLMSGFSQASFSVFSQNTGNGTSSTFVAQGTISRQSPAAGAQQSCWPSPQPAPSPRNDNYRDNYRDSYRDNSRDNTARDRCAGNDTRNQTPPQKDCGCKKTGGADQTQWSNTEVSGNKASIDLGNYKLAFDKADSSMVMTNAKTGDTTKIWGDPHIDQHTNSASKTSAMFNGPMTFQLPDNTKITVGTQPGANNKSVTYADQVTITHGNQAYQVSGLSQQNASGLSVQKSGNGRALDDATPDGYTLQAAADGSGWIDPTTGKQPTASDFKKATA